MPASPTRRRPRATRAATPAPPSIAGLKLVAGMGQRRRRLSPAARPHRAYHGRGHRGRAPPRLSRLRQDARADRRDDGHRPNSAPSASIRRCSRPTRCSPMTRAGRGGSTRRSIPASPPRRRSSGSASAPPQRMRQIDDPAARGPDARSRRPRQPAAADRLGPARHRRPDRPAPGCDPDRPQSRAGRIARI